MGKERTERLDAGEAAFVARALESVENQTYDILFPPLEGRMHVSMVSVPEGAKSTTYRQYRRTGLAKLITESGDDYPTSGFSVAEFSKQLYLLGNSYQYDYEELREAAFASRNGQGAVSIDGERAAAAREAMERAIDVAIAIGSATSATIPGLSVGIGTDVGMLGLLNQTLAATYTPANSAAVPGSPLWANKTPDEKLADLNGLVTSQVNATYKVHRPVRIILPIDLYENAASQRLGDGSDDTVISFFEKVRPGIKVSSWQYCSGAGTNGANRAVAFDPNPRFVRFMIARDFTIEGPVYTMRGAKVPCTAKIAGVVCPYPLSITYMDGI